MLHVPVGASLRCCIAHSRRLQPAGQASGRRPSKQPARASLQLYKSSSQRVLADAPPAASTTNAGADTRAPAGAKRSAAAAGLADNRQSPAKRVPDDPANAAVVDRASFAVQRVTVEANSHDVALVKVSDQIRGLESIMIRIDETITKLIKEPGIARPGTKQSSELGTKRNAGAQVRMLFDATLMLLKSRLYSDATFGVPFASKAMIQSRRAALKTAALKSLAGLVHHLQNASRQEAIDFLADLAMVDNNAAFNEAAKDLRTSMLTAHWKDLLGKREKLFDSLLKTARKADKRDSDGAGELLATYANDYETMESVTTYNCKRIVFFQLCVSLIPGGEKNKSKWQFRTHYADIMHALGDLLSIEANQPDSVHHMDSFSTAMQTWIAEAEGSKDVRADTEVIFSDDEGNDAEVSGGACSACRDDGDDDD